MNCEAAHTPLGVPKWKTIFSIVLPTAFSGIITGIPARGSRVCHGVRPHRSDHPRALHQAIASNLFDGNMAHLPTMINQDRTGVTHPGIRPDLGRRAHLILLILLLNLLGRFISSHASKV